MRHGRVPSSPQRSPFGLPTILGGLLLLAGVLFLGYAIGIYMEWLPGSTVSVPKPVALEQPRPTTEPTRAVTPTPAVRSAPAATPTMRPAPTRQTGTNAQSPGVRPTPRPVTGAML